MVLRRPRDPVPRKPRSLKQIEKDRKIFDNLVELFPQENIKSKIRESLKRSSQVTKEVESAIFESFNLKPFSEEESKRVDKEFIALETLNTQQALVRLWLNILLDFKTDGDTEKIKLGSDLFPQNNQWVYHDPYKKAYEAICSDFDLTILRAAIFFESFTKKIAEKVEKTGAVELPKNMVIKKNDEGFYLQ